MAGRDTAVRISGDPVATNNGLFYLYSDQLGSTSAMQAPDGTVTQTRYTPFGDYRTGSTTNPITDRGYTGQKENMELGLMYYNARYYIPSLGRFLSADTIVPNPANPQSYNRYSYTRNNPINLIDPTGNVECSLLPGKDKAGCSEGKTTAKSLSNSCAKCGWDEAFGAMGNAYKTLNGLENALGRSLSYEDILAVTIAYEYDWLGDGISNEDFQTALETTGRLLYYFCGSEGVCSGDDLWKFLGYHDGFTNKYSIIDTVIDEVFNNPGTYSRAWSGAKQILSQPYYNSASASDNDRINNWRSGNDVNGAPIPFAYGNYSLYSNVPRKVFADVSIGTSKNALLVNISDINGGNGYMVMTPGQRRYWKNYEVP